MLADETLEEIERRALEITAAIERRDGEFNAEIVPGCTPHWHLLETLPYREFKAAEFLIERHFGIFLPTFVEGATLIFDGVDLCAGRRLIFPGHMFVFVWDIARHWRRIKTCPGVLRVLMDQPEHPVVVSDAAIDFIQALQFGLTPTPRKGKRKSRKQRYEQPQPHESGEDTVKLSNPSHWKDIGGLDGEGRNLLLRKALGLETITS